jgi:hypothetical protein
LIRFVSVTGLAALLAAAVVGAGGAATRSVSASYSAVGVETSIPTSNTSPFAGTAIGSSGDAAVWTASVVHQPLSACPFGSGASCAITGGSFSLTSSSIAHVTGSFTGGTVTPVTQQAPCGKQVFAVDGTLSTTSGAASLTATLTHYRTSILGTCVIYFATISGSLKVG